MPRIMLSAILLSIAMTSADDTGPPGMSSWVKGQNMCGAAALSGCENAANAACTKTSVGPCKEEEKPTSYLTYVFEDLAYVNDVAYLSAECTTSTDCKDIQAVRAQKNPNAVCPSASLKQVFESSSSWPVAGKDDDGGDTIRKVAFTSSGADFLSQEPNDCDNAGFAGMATYMLIDDENLGLNYNWYKDRDGNKYKACIVPGGTCADDEKDTVTFKPDDFKFTLYGYTYGQNGATFKGPTNYSHLGVRIRLSLTGAKMSEVKVSGKITDQSGTTNLGEVPIDEIGTADVTKIIFPFAEGKQELTFPKTYKFGDSSGAKADEFLPITGEKEVTIHVSYVPATNTDEFLNKDDDIYIDFLFVAEDLTKGDSYFVYDPTLSPADSGKGDDEGDGDNPCFGRNTHVCRLLSPQVSAQEAFSQCFHGANSGAAERVHMSDLLAGDVVMSSPDAFARVVVNQHRIDDGTTSQLIDLKHAHGLLTLTPDHMLMIDGAFTPARAARVGAMLSNGEAIDAIAYHRAGIINPITSTGTILAAGATGEPVLAAAGNEWLADVMLSAYPQYTLSYTLARLFPFSVQTYYDAALEPLFTMAVPTLAELKAAAPAPLVGLALVAGDAALAAGLGIFSLGLKGAATLAVAVAAVRFAASK